jgi:hypothetical protein
MRVPTGALVATTFLTAPCAHGGGGGPSARAKPPVPPARIRLFDGATLKGWSGSPDIWSVKDGAIHGVSEHGGQLILTDGDFSDFRLILKSRLRSEKNHLGVCFWAITARTGAMASASSSSRPRAACLRKSPIGL